LHPHLDLRFILLDGSLVEIAVATRVTGNLHAIIAVHYATRRLVDFLRARVAARLSLALANASVRARGLQLA